MQLAPYRQESALLASFRADTSAPQQLDVTNVTIVSYTGEISLSVLVVPRISAPLHSIATSKVHELPYLRGLTLAHPIIKEDCQFDLSMLIGVDYYWKIVEDHIVRGDSCSIKTRLSSVWTTNSVILLLLWYSHEYAHWHS